MPVQIATLGNNYNFTSISGGPVTVIGPNATMPFWEYDITTGFYEDDPSATMSFLWGTATCANDILTGQVPPAVPIPPSALLLGSGLVGLVGLGWRRKSQSSAT